jgi:tRNA-dihydrouridine synthase 2
MVRASTLPLRLLALKYGATQVFSEEIIDRSISSCERVVNDRLKCVDYVKRKAASKKQQKSGRDPSVVVFRTCPALERGKLVFQLGTADPELAAAAAKVVEGDVDGIDVNMGCPKKFSVAGGMGSALLANKVRAASIISAVKAAVSVPVSCKIRLVGSDEDGEEKLLLQTADFMRAMEAAGAASITIHARTITDSSHEPCAKRRWDTIRSLFECVAVPVMLNGDIYTREDIERVRSTTKAGGVMLARGALWDCSVFGEVGGEREKPDRVMEEYLKLCVRYDNHFVNTKYVVCEFMNMRRHPPALRLGTNVYAGGQTVAAVCSTKVIEDLCSLWDVDVEKERAAEEVGGGDREKRTGEAVEEVLDKVYSDDYFLKEEEKEELKKGGEGAEGEERPAKKLKAEARSNYRK